MWKSACSFTANNSRKFFPLKTACDSVPMSFVKAQHGAVHLFTFYGACSLKYLAERLPSSSNPFISTTVSELLNQSAVPQDRADQPVLMKVILKTPLLYCQCELHYKHCSSVMLIPEEAAWNLPPPEHTSIYSLCMNLTFAFRLQIAKQRMCKVLELRTKHFDLLFHLNLRVPRKVHILNILHKSPSAFSLQINIWRCPPGQAAQSREKAIRFYKFASGC